MIDSPEILKLNDSEFRLLVSVWCLAKDADDGGNIDYTLETLHRRVMPDHRKKEFSKMVDHLTELGLLSSNDQGFSVPRWELHQYEYSSRIPSKRSDLRKDNGKDLESERKDNGKDLEAHGQIEPEPEPEPEDLDPNNNKQRTPYPKSATGRDKLFRPLRPLPQGMGREGFLTAYGESRDMSLLPDSNNEPDPDNKPPWLKDHPAEEDAAYDMPPVATAAAMDPGG
jgi:hypothetical protein